MNDITQPRLAEYQFTTEEAIDFAVERRWETLTPKERALLQIRQTCLCMDWAVFHAGFTELLGRPVYTHEFANADLLWAEYLGLAEKPSFDDIIAKLPERLRANMITVVLREDDGG